MKKIEISRETLERLVIIEKYSLSECLLGLKISKCTFFKRLKEFNLKLITKSYYCPHKGKRLLSVCAELHPNYKGGKPKCQICNIRLANYSGKRCSTHRDRTEKLNPNWRGGTTSLSHRIRSSKKYKEWRNDVFKRDDFTCKNCFKRGGWIEADHIKPFSLYPELRFTISNGRTLCRPCHLKIGWNPSWDTATATRSVKSTVTTIEVLN